MFVLGYGLFGFDGCCGLWFVLLVVLYGVVYLCYLCSLYGFYCGLSFGVTLWISVCFAFGLCFGCWMFSVLRLVR